ncbi:MAG TPA: urease accessory protein UreF [Puia sp.]|nr:urease accessory protein UreF [Puia sp.]
MSPAALSLFQLSDPALPIGGYAHSGGLETYVQAGVVRDRETAEGFVREMLTKNLRYTDAALMALSYGAASASDREGLLEADVLCEAVKLPKEIRQASQKLGMRLMKIFQGMAGSDAGRAMADGVRKAGHMLSTYGQALLAKQTPGHYCVAFGVCAAALGIGLREALTGFYYNAAAGMVTNCVKLIPMGQQDGQELLFSLQSLIGELVEKGMEPDKEGVGVCNPGFDIRCMQHEQLYSRLYMS